MLLFLFLEIKAILIILYKIEFLFTILIELFKKTKRKSQRNLYYNYYLQNKEKSLIKKLNKILFSKKIKF